MPELKFKDDKKALRKLSRVQNKIDKFISKRPGEMSNRDHIKLRKLLKNRAKALSNATGMEIHSLFD